MSNRSADSIFDSFEFVDDVLEWCIENGFSRRKLAKRADLDLSSLLQVLRSDRPLTLLTACTLATVCELSLDDYRTDIDVDGSSG